MFVLVLPIAARIVVVVVSTAVVVVATAVVVVTFLVAFVFVIIVVVSAVVGAALNVSSAIAATHLIPSAHIRSLLLFAAFAAYLAVFLTAN